MANEFKNSITVTYANGQYSQTYNFGTVQLPQATQGVEEQTIVSTSAAGAVTFSSITNTGQLILQSLVASSTGTSIDYSATATSTGSIGTPMGTLAPKAVHILNLNSTSVLRYQNVGAAAGNNRVRVICFEA